MLAGPAQGTEVRLSESRVVIGRDTAVDVTIDDQHISRRHVELEILPGAQGIIVHDLDSKNGTYVRNCRIIDAFVDEHALVSLGEDTVIQLALEDSQITGYARDRLGELVDPRLRAAAKEREVRSRRPRIDENPTIAIPPGLKDDD
ncbi:FHA domain-containing protein [Paraliomyxa miuraensis]|uniref:FHA domain-containing protein n=1 Tax=Paraliomyxa miuraensis TaxID=376150 RepID=UPI00225B4A09|nr:FHA domain-containing protein [Paraliomyxa miuraensis]MCX4244266.1 FHA domain-containing protein [Paraliomyxa miuraensis]